MYQLLKCSGEKLLYTFEYILCVGKELLLLFHALTIYICVCEIAVVLAVVLCGISNLKLILLNVLVIRCNHSYSGST
jgi:hypothetical protein